MYETRPTYCPWGELKFILRAVTVRSILALGMGRICYFIPIFDAAREKMKLPYFFLGTKYTFLHWPIQDARYKNFLHLCIVIQIQERSVRLPSVSHYLSLPPVSHSLILTLPGTLAAHYHLSLTGDRRTYRRKDRHEKEGKKERKKEWP